MRVPDACKACEGKHVKHVCAKAKRPASEIAEAGTSCGGKRKGTEPEAGCRDGQKRLQSNAPPPQRTSELNAKRALAREQDATAKTAGTPMGGETVSVAAIDAEVGTARAEPPKVRGWDESCDASQHGMDRSAEATSAEAHHRRPQDQLSSPPRTEAYVRTEPDEKEKVSVAGLRDEIQEEGAAAACDRPLS